MLDLDKLARHNSHSYNMARKSNGHQYIIKVMSWRNRAHTLEWASIYYRCYVFEINFTAIHCTAVFNAYTKVLCCTDIYFRIPHTWININLLLSVKNNPIQIWRAKSFESLVSCCFVRVWKAGEIANFFCPARWSLSDGHCLDSIWIYIGRLGLLGPGEREII